MNTRNKNPGVGSTTTGADSEQATSSTTASSDGTESRPDLVVKQQTGSNLAEVVRVAGGTTCGSVFPSLRQWTGNGAFRADVTPALQPRGGESTEVIFSGTTFTLSGTQSAVHDCAAVLPSSVVLLAGTAPVGQWYTKVYPQKGAYANGSFQEAVAYDQHAADALLRALAEDDAFLLSEERQLLAEGNRSRSMATDTTPLLRVNRSDLWALQNNAHLPYALRCSIVSFLNRYKHSRWMQWQPNYPARIGISVAAEWDCGKAVALCGVNNWLCQHPDYCPRCSVRLRAKPAAREYRHSFELAPFWYAISPSFELNPNRAGLRFVTQKPDRKNRIPGKHRRFNPYEGRKLGVPLTSDAHLVDGEHNPVLACFSAVFKLADALVSSGVAGGVLAQREVAWHFRPHRVTPNGHLLVNTPGPIGFELAKAMLFVFERFYLSQPNSRKLYPDLHIEPLLSQREINRWIFYMLKPMDLVTGYLQSVQAGVDIAALNVEVDDRVFQGGSKILSVRSPRRFGNLRCNGDGYIGSGSITAWRKEQAERRKAERGRLGLHKPKPPPSRSRLGRVIDREAARIEAKV